MNAHLRCAECGIADEGVGKDRWHGNVPRDCLAAALSLLELARPYVEMGIDQLPAESDRVEARALLAQMPVKP